MLLELKKYELGKEYKEFKPSARKLKKLKIEKPVEFDRATQAVIDDISYIDVFPD